MVLLYFGFGFGFEAVAVAVATGGDGDPADMVVLEVTAGATGVTDIVAEVSASVLVDGRWYRRSDLVQVGR